MVAEMYVHVTCLKRFFVEVPVKNMQGTQLPRRTWVCAIARGLGDKWSGKEITDECYFCGACQQVNIIHDTCGSDADMGSANQFLGGVFGDRRRFAT